jgi:urease accessory protein
MSKYVYALALLTGTLPALVAHPGHDQAGFTAGLLHPLTGLDHLLAMLAVGMLAVRCGGKALWLVPLTFLASMLAGGFLAYAGVPMPLGEWAIALSVLVFGTMIAIATRPGPMIACLIVGVLALFHGHAHVAEMSAGLPLAAFCGGFLLSTALLHGMGIAIGVLMTRGAPLPVLRISGALIAAASILVIARIA